MHDILKKKKKFKLNNLIFKQLKWVNTDLRREENNFAEMWFKVFKKWFYIVKKMWIRSKYNMIPRNDFYSVRFMIDFLSLFFSKMHTDICRDKGYDL